MTTLATSIRAEGHGKAPAIIIPGKLQPFTISYEQLKVQISSFQQKLISLGITSKAAVSIALPNSYEFVIAFLAASWQRAIAAPLNPSYKQSEFEFYIEDLNSALALVPRGSFKLDNPAVRAARRYKAAIAECYWDGQDVVLDVKDYGKLKGIDTQSIQIARPGDIALILHTSGTTGRPKAVRSRSLGRQETKQATGSFDSPKSYNDHEFVLLRSFSPVSRTDLSRKYSGHLSVDLRRPYALSYATFSRPRATCWIVSTTLLWGLNYHTIALFCLGLLGQFYRSQG